MYFGSIVDDLKHRKLEQQVEILWISGPTWHDAAKIAQRLNITVDQVNAIVAKL
jgi:DNA-binding CsgD family transcriptional regulator